MFIQKIEGWTSVGHLETDVYVPYNTDIPRDFVPVWSIENVHPSVDKLFTSFTLPINDEKHITLENLRNTKYIKLQYDIFDYPFYGWVDGTTLKSKRHITVVWHPDYWRTYFRRCQYRGWKKLRAPTGKDPYHIIPAFHNHATLEDIPIGHQIRGVAWVTITYVEGDYLATRAISALGKALIPDKFADGLKEIIGGAINLVGGGIVAAIARNLKSGEITSPEKMVIPSISDYLPDYEVVRCLTFPISLNAGENVYFTSAATANLQTDPDTKHYYGATMFEVINGAFGTVMGIKADQIINCVVSPVSPFPIINAHTYGVGSKGNPIILKNADDPMQMPTFKSEDYRTVSSASSNGRGFLKIEGYGIKDVGNIKDGCPLIGEILDLYYLGYYDIIPIQYEENGQKYTVHIKKNLLATQGSRLFKFTTYMDAVFPQWRTYGEIDIHKMVRTIPARIKVTDIYYAKEGGSLWELVKDPRDNNVYIWKNRDLELIDIMRDFDKYEDETPKVIDILHSTAIIKSEEYEARVNYDQLYVAVADEEIGGWPDEFEYAPKMYINQFNFATYYKLAFTTSSKNFSWMGGVYSSTVMFGKIRGKLPHPYYTDDYNELLLVGPNGNIIHRFKTGLKILGYTYQLVVDGNTPYIKIKFDLEKGSTIYTMASESEVHVPLTPMIAFTSYSNPWRYLNEVSERYVRNQFENEQVARARMLEIENVELERKKETTGISAGSKIIASTIGNETMGWVKGAFNKVGEFFDWLGWGNHRKQSEKNFADSAQRIGDEFKAVGATEALFPTVKTFWGHEDDIRGHRWQNEDIERNFRHKIGGFEIEPTVSSTLSFGDTSWLTENTGLRLVHLTKDDYSINRYHETAGVIGIEVNEHVSNFIEFTPGPLKVEPCILQGQNVPAEAISYIKARLEYGVYIDKNL